MYMKYEILSQNSQNKRPLLFNQVLQISIRRYKVQVTSYNLQLTTEAAKRYKKGSMKLEMMSDRNKLNTRKMFQQQLANYDCRKKIYGAKLANQSLKKASYF